MKKIVLFVFVLVLTSPLMAQDASQRFSDVMLSLETLSGEFSQEILDVEGDSLQKTHGSFKVKRPGFFLWEIAPPYQQTVVGTPNSLKVYDPDLEQMTIHAQDSLAGSPALLISGDVTAIAVDYDVSRENNNKTETFTLRPKNEDTGAFSSLQFSFTRQGKYDRLEQMRFVDKLGQTTRIDIDKIKINKRIAEQHFEFEPPAGTDIIIDG